VLQVYNKNAIGWMGIAVFSLNEGSVLDGLTTRQRWTKF